MDYVAIWEEPDREKGLDVEATKKRVSVDELRVPIAVKKWNVLIEAR